MKLLHRDIELGASVEHVRSLLSDLGELERDDDPRVECPNHPGLVTLGRFRDRIVRVYEAAPGCPFPAYETRRSLQGKGTDRGSGLIIFTDSAHSAFVWTWRTRHHAGLTRYTEFNAANRRRQLRDALASLSPGAAVTGRAKEPDALVTERLVQTILPIQERPAVSEAAGLQAILDRIERFDDPDQVRTVWRRLRGFSVLHPDCPDGERLVKAGAALELVLIAVLERMQSFLDDSLVRRDRRRPEHLRDFRALLEAVEGRAADHDGTRYVRRMIVQQNLFAVVSSRAAGRAVLRDLLEYAGSERPPLPLIDCNIWRRRDPDGRVGRVTPRLAATERASPPATELDEEIALHRKAWEMVRRVRLAGGDHRALRGAAFQLQKRRQLLLRQLRELAEPEDSHDFPEQLAFYRLSSGRAFSAVLEAVRPG